MIVHKRVLSVGSAGLFVGALVALFAATSAIPATDFLKQTAVRIALILVLLFLSSSLLLRLVIRNVGLRPAVQNLCLVLYALVVLSLLLEAVFTFVPRSHSFGDSLAARRWKHYYWKPINAYGYRDKPVPDDLPQRKRLYILGDSFTAGYGIKNARDRYTDVLGALLPDHIAVVNLGIAGSGTGDARDRLATSQLAPQIIIYQYFANDIEPLAQDMGKRYLYRPYNGLPDAATYLIQNSFVLNYAYWRSPRPLDQSYVDHLTALFADTRILAAHLADLGQIIDLASEQSAALVVVIFPFMRSPSESRFCTGRIARFLSERNVPFINVEDLVGDLEPKQRTVNANDGHPSVEVHRRVGEALYDTLVRLQYVP